MKHMEASKSTDVSMLDYRIVRSTVSNTLYCVIAVDDKENPLFADLVDVDLHEAMARVQARETLRMAQELQNQQNT